VHPIHVLDTISSRTVHLGIGHYYCYHYYYPRFGRSASVNSSLLDQLFVDSTATSCMDEHYEIGGSIERPDLTMKPSEYFRRRGYVTIEPDVDSAQKIQRTWIG
jgi:hypothetical protein